VTVPLNLSALKDADQQDFLARLNRFGLDASAGQQELVVPRSSTINLAYGPNRDSFIKPVVLNVSDLAIAKRMIGVDDRVFQHAPSAVPLPRAITLPRAAAERPFVATPGLVRQLQPAEIDTSLLQAQHVENIRVAARAYLRGDSAVVSSYKPLIETYYGTIEIPVWVFVNVKVAAGSTLTFGPGVNALVACSVEIEEGGTILSYGHLTVDCTTLRRTFPLTSPSPGIGLQVARFQ
jgi:hypothetical protein